MPKLRSTPLLNCWKFLGMFVVYPLFCEQDIWRRQRSQHNPLQQSLQLQIGYQYPSKCSHTAFFDKTSGSPMLHWLSLCNLLQVILDGLLFRRQPSGASLFCILHKLLQFLLFHTHHHTTLCFSALNLFSFALHEWNALLALNFPPSVHLSVQQTSNWPERAWKDTFWGPREQAFFNGHFQVQMHNNFLCGGFIHFKGEERGCRDFVLIYSILFNQN